MIAAHDDNAIPVLTTPHIYSELMFQAAQTMRVTLRLPEVELGYGS